MLAFRHSRVPDHQSAVEDQMPWAGHTGALPSAPQVVAAYTVAEPFLWLRGTVLAKIKVLNQLKSLS